MESLLLRLDKQWLPLLSLGWLALARDYPVGLAKSE